MTTLEEANAKLDHMDLQLDAIRELVASLKVDVPVTQEQLDALNARLDALNTEADAVTADEPPAEPTPEAA